MPYNEVQRKTGSFIGTSGTVAFDNVTNAGTTVVLVVASADSPGLFPPQTPTVFNWEYPVNGPGSGTCETMVCSRRGVSAGEQSWTQTMTAVTNKVVNWALFEYAGLDATATDQSGPGAPGSNVTTISSSSNLVPVYYDNLALAAVSAYMTSTTVPTITETAGGFSELLQTNASDGSAKIVALSVQAKPATQITRQERITASLSPTVDEAQAGVVLFPCTDAKIWPAIRNSTGFEFGPAPNLTSGVVADATRAPLFATTGTISIEAAAARTGNFGLRVFGTSATSNAKLHETLDGTTGYAWVHRVCLRFRSALPSNDLLLFSVGNAQFWFRNATDTIGAVIVGGSEQASDAAIVAGQWFAFDLKYDTSTTTYKLDWQVDYNANPGNRIGSVVQTQATFTAGATSTAADVVFGWQSATTGDIDVDDYAFSQLSKAYPIGDARSWPLTIDTSNAAQVTGTIGNFALVTANSTGTALSSGNLATAVSNIAEVPVVVGVSAAGVCQTAAASGSYIDFPLTTRNAAANNETILGFKMYVCGWTAGSAGNNLYLGISNAPFGGADTIDMLTTAETPSFGTTTAVWCCKSMRPGTPQFLTQSRLDGTGLRMGEALDATPDPGILGAVAEVVMQPSVKVQFAGDIAVADMDPNSNGIETLTVNAPASTVGDTNVYYETSGTPTSYTVTQNTQDVHAIGTDDGVGLNYVAIYPPAEPV